MTLLNYFTKELDRFDLTPHLAGQRVVIGVSGGADSLCLLHLLKQLSPSLNMSIYVATLDHELRGEASAADAAFVTQIARRWNLPVYLEKRDVKAIAHRHSLGIEEAARQTRYTSLAQIAQKIDAKIIAVGHNADDQAETILMHLIRGTGLAGLRGMLPLTPLSAYHLLPDAPQVTGITLARPLLSVPRADIDAYCATHDLHPRQDATNKETTYFRNRIRHEIFPLLETLNPNIRALLGRTGRILAADYEQLQGMVKSEYQTLLRQKQAGMIRLDRERFRQQALSTALRYGVLRQAIRDLAPELQDIGFITINQAVNTALDGETGSEATLPGGLVLRVDYGDLVLSKPDIPRSQIDWPSLEPNSTLGVQVPGRTPLPGSEWQLRARWLKQGETPSDFYERPFTAVLAMPQDAVLSLRTRRAGDRFAPRGMNGHTQKLSDLFINAKVPANQRDHVPLLWANNEIACVFLGTRSRIAENFAVHTTTSRALLIYWENI